MTLGFFPFTILISSSCVAKLYMVNILFYFPQGPRNGTLQGPRDNYK